MGTFERWPAPDAARRGRGGLRSTRNWARRCPGVGDNPRLAAKVGNDCESWMFVLVNSLIWT